MKISTGLNVNKYHKSSEGIFKWYQKDAKKIKQGITYRHRLSHYWTTNVEPIEIYTIEEKDRKSETYWLIEHKILKIEGKLEFKPRGPVSLDKEDSKGYWSLILPNAKKLFTDKELKEKEAKKKGSK